MIQACYCAAHRTDMFDSVFKLVNLCGKLLFIICEQGVETAGVHIRQRSYIAQGDGQPPEQQNIGDVQHCLNTGTAVIVLLITLKPDKPDAVPIAKRRRCDAKQPRHSSDTIVFFHHRPPR